MRRPDPAVSQRLQQASEKLQAAIASARKIRLARNGEVAEDPSGKAWRLAPTVIQGPEHEEYCKEVSDKENDAVNCEQQQQSADDDMASVAPMPQSLTKGAVELRAPDGLVERGMRKALEWMQRDVERQARENRVVRETLSRAIHDITDLIADFVAPEAASTLQRTAAAATGVSLERDNNVSMLQLTPDKVDEIVSQWDDALVSWREQNLAEKQELMECSAHFEEECLARMVDGELSHRLAQERLALESNQQQMICEDYASKVASAQSEISSLQMQVAQLSSQLSIARADTRDTATVTEKSDSESKTLQRKALDPGAHAKSSELYAMHCESALAEQTQRAKETENRLYMLLEECHARQHQRKTAQIPIEAIQMHRQKLDLLDGRIQDVLQQVACDHEQFEYEQAKWALEKRHHREKYDEVLDASVKVLKVLIIRVKLMKRNERAQERASQECQEKQLELASQAASLHGITTELMQQSAMVLLVLQQLTVLKSNASKSQATPTTWTLPAKPVQMKNTIKRLKKIEAALKRRDWIASAPATTYSPSTKVCPLPVA